MRLHEVMDDPDFRRNRKVMVVTYDGEVERPAKSFYLMKPRSGVDPLVLLYVTGDGVEELWSVPTTWMWDETFALAPIEDVEFPPNVLRLACEVCEELRRQSREGPEEDEEQVAPGAHAERVPLRHVQVLNEGSGFGPVRLRRGPTPVDVPDDVGVPVLVLLHDSEDGS